MRLASYAVFIGCIVIGVHFTGFAQQSKTPADSIVQRIVWTARQQPSASLFVHFDKTIYSNNENVWFTGYIIKTNTTGIQHTLCVAVIRNYDRSVLAEGKYVMDNGLAFGNLVLPDSLPAGNYSLVCYTNLFLNGHPTSLFVQPVTIKSGDAGSFNATLNVTDGITAGKDSTTVLLKAMTKDYTLVKKAAVQYFLGDRAHPSHTGLLKTDNFGEATIRVPVKEITPANNVLEAEINNGKEVKSFSIKLPVYKKTTLVKFYPEGGHLVDAAASTVGWEVTDTEGEPLTVQAGLYKDDLLVQTIRSNVYGMGTFLLTPEKGSRYYVKLQNAGTDSLYRVPASLPGGPVINMLSALSGDTLFVSVNTQGIAGTLQLLVHDYRELFINAPIVTSGKTMLLKIPLQEIPRGLTTLTLLDSLARPVAERLFFAHFDKRIMANISVDSTLYAPRQQVVMKLKLEDAGHHPVTGLVSVACVQHNRMEPGKTMNIESYAYLTNDLQAFPAKRNLLSNDAESKAFLEQVLLIKGWRKYTWQDMMMIQSTDTLPATSLRFTGKVSLNKKALKKPVQLNLKNFVTPKFSELQIITTDSTGNFELLPEKIVSEQERRFELTVRSDRQSEYTVTANDPYKSNSKSLAASLLFADYSPVSFAQNSQAFVLKNGEVAKVLKTVVVTSKKDDSFFGALKAGMNICGDYICMNGILNCSNHPNDRYEPVVGKIYSKRFGSSMVKEVYFGCTALTQEAKNEYLFAMNGIYKRKEFYVTDLTKVDVSDPQYLSTLYWNYSILTNANGEATVTFYTGDIEGKFRVVVQGITNDNVVYGEQSFEVKAK